jgi:TonB family protein
MNAQELFIGHLLPIAATIAVLWLVYRVLFRESNRLLFNRFFLLTSMLLALAMPLLGLLSGMEAPQMVTLKQNMFNGMILNEVVVTPDGEPILPEVMVTTTTAPSRFSWWQVIGGIYLIGVGVMMLLFLFKLGKLVVLIIRSPKRKMSSCTAVFTGREQGSFSFFRYAFFPNENVDPDIMRHELSHIRHHHSWDILFAELMMILQWFNPFIYLYKKELQSLHEYQADRDVVATGVDKKNYMMLILQQCTAVDFSGMSNNFSLILTKKRIKMITKNEKAKGLWWRLLATLPVLALLMIANTKVTAQEQKADAIKKDVLTIQMGDFELFNDDGTQMQLKDTVVYYEDGTYTKFESSEAVDPFTGELRKTFTLKNYTAEGTPNPNINFTIREVEKHGDTMLYSMDPFTISGDIINQLKNKIMTDEDINVEVTNVGIDSSFQAVKEDLYQTLKNKSVGDSIYQVVEQMPEFPGGVEAMMQYVVDNVKYPQDAINEGKSGRVFVSFVVEKDGRVSNVKVMKGVCESIDKEAVRVVSSMPRWYAGMHKGEPVRVRYMMPIKFQARDLTGDGETDAAMVRMEDENGHSYHIDRSVETDNQRKAGMKPDKNGVYQIVEEMPQYPGGEKAMMEYVAKNVAYPQEARDKEISGRVFVSFVVEKDGSIGEVKVMRGIGGGCDEEAVRVIKGMPKWKPGKQEGKPVRVSYMMPINFKLSDGQESKGSLANTAYMGKGTGTKDGVTYTMRMTMEFESNTTGYFVMTLNSQKKNEKAQVEFEDVGLPFTYTFDGKSSGSIQPTNPDGSQLGEMPATPYGFIINKDNTIQVNFYDLKDDIGVDKIVFKKVGKNTTTPNGWPVN